MLSMESIIQSIGDKPLPPVESWNPCYCGELDLLIKADGTWLYSGTPITRHKIKHLFSRVLKKEGDNYFLVTPVEKVSIQVEWEPFLIVDYQVIHKNKRNIYQFCDNFENKILLTQPTQIAWSYYQNQEQQANGVGPQKLPVIQVRRNLFANFSRNCYYQLLAEAEIVQRNDRNQVEIISNNIPFCLGEYTDL